ncbi:MAG: YncE family protein [Bacteroidia bacterium]|nr:YncE family protein [Bacteroidia bacterium]GIV23895.1 MAG: hypothetical protein KatS3mg025_1554 [Bacteroidia bacterium]
MKRPRLSFWLAGLWALLLGACRSAKEPPLAEASAFPEPVARILVRRCAGCHNGSAFLSSEAEHDHGGPSPAEVSWIGTRVNLTRWDSLLYGYRGEVGMVVPGSPDWSHLLWQVNRFPHLGPTAAPIMPPPVPDSSNLLTAEDIEVLRTWIAQGAPNKEGQVPWADRLTTPHRKAFVCAAGSDLIAVLDLDTYHIMRYIPVGVSPGAIESPHYIQISPDKRYLYVTLIGGAAIEKYRTDTYEKVGRLAVAPDPAHIELSPDGRYAVITHFTTTSPVKLTLIDAENLRILDQLNDPTGQVILRPHGLWVTPDFRYAYVTANTGNYITRVELSPDRQRFIDFTQIPLAPGLLPQPDTRWGPYQIIGEPTGQYYFVSCDAANEVRVFRQADDSLIAVIPTATAPKLMTYANNLLFVLCLKASAPALQGDKLGAIAVIDVQNLRLLTHIYNTGHLPRGIGIDPIRQQLWVSFENLAGSDPPHHYVEGLAGSPGKVYVLALPTFTLQAVREIALAGYGLALIP